MSAQRIGPTLEELGQIVIDETFAERSANQGRPLDTADVHAIAVRSLRRWLLPTLDCLRLDGGETLFCRHLRTLLRE